MYTAHCTNILLLRDTANLYDARRAVDGSREIGLQHRKLGDGVLLLRGGLVVMKPRGEKTWPNHSTRNVPSYYTYIQAHIHRQRFVFKDTWLIFGGNLFLFFFFCPFYPINHVRNVDVRSYRRELFTATPRQKQIVFAKGYREANTTNIA